MNFNDSLELLVTGDGSHTIYNKDLNETYHSSFGAITESQCVFIDNGLKKFIGNYPIISILETGFGTGLNAFMTFLISVDANQKINYDSLEIYPLPEIIIEQLNYVEHLNARNFKDIFLKLHHCSYDKYYEITNNFRFNKLNKSIESYTLHNQYHLIFFDAFAPEINEELWGAEVMKNMYDSLKENGILVTYCSKGSVKRNLKQVGFSIANVAGPPGKREITIATKN